MIARAACYTQNMKKDTGIHPKLSLLFIFILTGILSVGPLFLSNKPIYTTSGILLFIVIWVSGWTALWRKHSAYKVLHKVEQHNLKFKHDLNLMTQDRFDTNFFIAIICWVPCSFFIWMMIGEGLRLIIFENSFSFSFDDILFFIGLVQ